MDSPFALKSHVRLRAFAAAVAALALLAVAAGDARAAGGVYTVWADCTDNHLFAQSDSTGGQLAASTACAGRHPGIRAVHTASGGNVANGGIAQQRFDVPNDGVRIAGMRWRGARQFADGSTNWGGWHYRTGILTDGFGVVDGAEAKCDFTNWGHCWTESSGKRYPRQVGWHSASGLGNSTFVLLYAQCVNDSGGACPGTSNGIVEQEYRRIGISMSRVELDLRDNWDPSYVNGRGNLWTSGGWLSGTQSMGFDAQDNTGISSLHVQVDGASIGNSGGRPCDHRFKVPCANASADGSIDTATLSDGEHTARILAYDAAGNSAGWHERRFRVDNTAPAAPTDLRVGGGDGWRSTNSFSVSWSVPGAQHAPLTGAGYKLCKVSGGCTEGRLPGATSVGGFAVDRGVGDYTLQVRAHDAAGNAGAYSGPVSLRWDDVAPGAAEPGVTNGWLNAAERRAFKQHVRLLDRTFKPVSGIAGYSITTDGSDPDNTIEAPGEEVEWPIGDLPEGVNTIRARAVSGAGIASAEVRSVEVRVDLSRPTASVEGAPDPARWQRRPVTVELRGADQPGLSGMMGSDPQQAIEDGAYIAYRIDGGELQRVRGGSAPVTVADEGEHTIAYHAVDLAGNESETRTVQLKIDRTSPVAGATSDAVDPAVWQREAVTATLTGDDGAGRSGMDPAPDDRPVEEGGHLVYRLNAGPLERARGASATFQVADDGDHAVEYYAVDGAGNESEAKTLRFRIDRTAPDPVTLEAPGADRRRIEVEAADATSGVDEVQVGLRRVGSTASLAALRRAARRQAARRGGAVRSRRGGGRTCRRGSRAVRRRCPSGRRRGLRRQRIAPLGPSWRMLPAVRDGARWVAMLPEDESLAPGIYQLQAVARDRAGNERATDRFRSGDPALIDPCRAPGACRPPGETGPGGAAGPGGSGTAGSNAAGPGGAPLDRGPDPGTVDTRVVAGAVKRVRIRTRVPRRCKRPRSAALRRRCREARRPRYRTAFTTRVRTGFRRPAVLRGAVTTAEGAPVAGGTVDVIVVPRAAGQHARLAATVRTDAAGAFSYTAPAGASRTVTFRFRGLERYRRSEASAEVLVPAAATLRSSRRAVANGQSVVFGGRLLSRPLPARGKVVDLQVHYRGRWRTFAAPRADRRGRFRFRYRFEATRRTTTYRFRARLRPESAYPYELGYSRTVRVRVRGR